MSQTLVLVVDANPKIGLGHLSRCLILADSFSKAGIQVVFCSHRESDIFGTVKDKGYRTISTRPFLAQEYPEAFMTIIREHAPSMLFFDLLENDLVQHTFLTQKNEKIAAICIGSLSTYEYKMKRFEDITFFPNIKPLDYGSVEGINGPVPVLSGPSYLIFRPEFANVWKKKNLADPNRVLITYGGSDPENLTERTVHALNANVDLFPSVVFDVVLGSLNRKKDTIKNICISSPCRFEIHEHVSAMTPLISRAGIGIINGGTTRYEFGLCGTPFIALSLNKAQKDISDHAASLGGGISLGIHTEISDRDIVDTVQRMLTDDAYHISALEKMPNILDCSGADRIVDRMMSLNKGT